MLSDIDECQYGNGRCDHTCVNEEGSHHCECEAGYLLLPDGQSCEGIFRKHDIPTSVVLFMPPSFITTFYNREYHYTDNISDRK